MISAWDNLHLATLELVRATPIKQRLVCAYRRHLSALRIEDLPAEVRDQFEHVVAAFLSVSPLRGEDAVYASVRKMSAQVAEDCATQIVEIYGIATRTMVDAMRQNAMSTPHLTKPYDAETGNAASLIERV